jgi:hypothetical protein
MAEKVIPSEYEEAGLNPFNAPIPGESLTSSPENPKSWERPPKFTEEDEAMMAVYMELTEQDTLRKLIGIISEGIALDEIAQTILYKGYTEGQFSPDMMLMLAEPTIYLLISIADYAEIKDYVLYNEEDNDPDTEISEDDITPINIDDEGIEKKTTKEEFKPTEEVLSKSLLSKVKKELPSKIKDVVTEEEKV